MTTKPKAEPVTVQVPEVRAAAVSPGKAWRIILGRFIVRFIESFGGSVVGLTLFMPANAADWQKIGVLFLQPLITSLYQAGRGAWPSIKQFLESGGEEEPVVSSGPTTPTETRNA